MMIKHKPQVTADSYEENAFHPLRIESITQQVRELSYSGYTNVLEIGTGKNVLKHILELFPQVSHTSIDIAADLNPDYVGSVIDMPFEDNQFDVVICGEVLEHLPLDDFLPSLKEIHRVARHKVILSLPDKRRRFGVAVCLARLGWFRFEWNPSRRCYARKTFEFNGSHYWEMGCKGALGKDVERKIKQVGFTIEKQYRLWVHEWHCFFILRP